MEVINHEEATQLAATKPDSNLARCYLSLRAENEALRGAIAKAIQQCQPLRSGWISSVETVLRAALSGGR